MPPGQPPGITQGATVPYRSTACWIGTHGACAEPFPAAPVIDAPLIYETCSCACHLMTDGGSAREVPQ